MGTKMLSTFFNRVTADPTPKDPLAHWTTTLFAANSTGAQLIEAARHLACVSRPIDLRSHLDWLRHLHSEGKLDLPSLRAIEAHLRCVRKPV